MMFLPRHGMLLGILTVVLASLRVQANPLTREKTGKYNYNPSMMRLIEGYGCWHGYLY
jgi:hypothetical protein